MTLVSWVVVSMVCAIVGAILGIFVGLFLANPARERALHQLANPTQRSLRRPTIDVEGVSRAKRNPACAGVAARGMATG